MRTNEPEYPREHPRENVALMWAVPISVLISLASAMTTSAGITNKTDAATTPNRDEFYTEEGVRIRTPARGMKDLSQTNTLRADATIIYPDEGIRIFGDITIEDFQKVQNAIEPGKHPEDEEWSIAVVQSKKIQLIDVRNSTQIVVTTIVPLKKGHCSNGDSIKLEKKSGKWRIISIGRWTS